MHQAPRSQSKNLWWDILLFFHIVFKFWYVFYIYHTAQIQLDTFQVLHSHMWWVAPVLDSTDVTAKHGMGWQSGSHAASGVIRLQEEPRQDRLTGNENRLVQWRNLARTLTQSKPRSLDTNQNKEMTKTKLPLAQQKEGLQQVLSSCGNNTSYVSWIEIYKYIIN